MKLKPRLTNLNYNEILLYLGYHGQEIPDALNDQIKRCMSEAISVCEPRLVYRQLGATDGRIDRLPLEGGDIHTLLADSAYAILFAATLGPKPETLLMKKSVNDMADALIMDSIFSCAIENVCDNFEADLRAEVEAAGMYLTDRFSPGYGDLPIDSQGLICEALNTQRRIGLAYTDNSLLIPRKSVTAILGISNTRPTLRKRGCEFCSMFSSCDIRKDGRNCNG